MKKDSPLHILVTDLNHHVRNLLQRELIKEGYVVYMAGTQKEVDEFVCNKDLDLIIFDPELFEIFGESFFIDIKEKIKQIPIIIHGFNDFVLKIDNRTNIRFIEKNETSIYNLKKIAAQL